MSKKPIGHSPAAPSNADAADLAVVHAALRTQVMLNQEGHLLRQGYKAVAAANFFQTLSIGIDNFIQAYMKGEHRGPPEPKEVA